MTERLTGAEPAGPGTSDELARRLQLARGPALVIAPQSARLIAANELGASILGLAGKLDVPVALDGAMPAIVALRRAAARGARGPSNATQTLMFWTAAGATRLDCLIEVLGDEGPERLVLVEVPNTDRSSASATDTAERTHREARPATVPADRQAALSDPSRFANEDDGKGGNQGDWQSSAGIPSDSAAANDGTSNGSDRDEAAEMPSSSVPEREPAEASAPPIEASIPGRKASAVADAPARLGSEDQYEAHEGIRPSTSPEVQDAQEPRNAPVVKDMPPAPPVPPPPPLQLSDHDTLKAIARQILAGRKQPAASDTGRALTRDAGASRSDHQPARGGKSGTTGHGQATTLPMAARSSSVDVRRSTQATKEPVPSVVEDRPAPKRSNSLAESGDTPERAEVLFEKRRQDTAELPLQPPVAEGGCTPGQSISSMKSRRLPGARLDDPTRSRATRRTVLHRLAHELKTPISAIVSAAEVMKDERLGPIGDERYLRYARDIHESARHALLVVERILGAPMTDNHVTDLSFTNLDLNDVIKALGSSVEQLAVDAVVALQLRLAPRLPLVVADATSIRQIILNLLTNALKFTPRGGTVTISTQAQPGGPLVIEVSDTGPGMSGEQIAKATQDTSPETVAPRPAGGLGIGLPLARQLAMANGADLTINSPQHGGTQIRLIFPLSRQIPI